MLPRKPNPALRHPAPHNLDILIAPLQPSLEIRITAVPREFIIRPRRGQDSGGCVRGVRGREVGEAGVVRPEEGVEFLGSGLWVRSAGDEGGDVLACGAVGVEEEGWVRGWDGQGGEVEGFLVPVLRVCGRCVGGRDEGGEACVMGWVDGGGGGAELVEWGGGCGDVGEGGRGA